MDFDAQAKTEKAKIFPQPGRFGRFYLQELINSGGMADIWMATDPQGTVFATLGGASCMMRFGLT